jgi:uncharacterized membrane protein (DUF373 family)
MIFRPREPLIIKKFKKITEALAVGTGIIMFWRGIWLLADTYLYPEHAGISATISLLAWILTLLLTRSFVKQFLGEMQEEELRAERSMFERIMRK